MSSNAPYPLKDAGNRNPQIQSFEEEVMPSLSLTPMDMLHLQSLGEHLFPLWNSARLTWRASLDGICFGTECKPAVLLREGFQCVLKLLCSLPPHSGPSLTWEWGWGHTCTLFSFHFRQLSYPPIVLPGFPVLLEMGWLRVVQHLLLWKHVISHKK